MSKKQKIFSVIGVVVFLIASYAIYDYFTYVSTDNAQVDGHFVMLAGKVGGYVTKVNIKEGQRVKKDDILVEIDSRDYDNNMRQVGGELTSVEAKKTDSEKSFNRINSLYGKGVVAQQQYDNAFASFADIKAKWDAVSAQVSQAKLNLENTKIRAPSDGFIAKKSVEVGQLAAPGIPLIGFVDSEERWVTANFKETDLDRIKAEAAVKVSIDALDGHEYTGRVETISSATGATFTLLPPDNATGNFTKVVQRVPVRIRLDKLSDQDIEALRVGLSAYVKVRIH